MKSQMMNILGYKYAAATNKIQTLLSLPDTHEDLPRLFQVSQVAMIPLDLGLDAEILLDPPDSIGAHVPTSVDQDHFGFGLHEASRHRVSIKFSIPRDQRYSTDFINLLFITRHQ